MERGSFLKNTAWLVAGNIATMIVQLIIGAISWPYELRDTELRSRIHKPILDHMRIGPHNHDC